MSNPYLSLTQLANLESLQDDNQMMVIVKPADQAEQGTTTSVGYVDLSDFRDTYLLTEVNQQIAELQARPGNGAFASPITMTLTGVVTGSASFDGSANFSLATTMPDNSIPISAVQDLSSTLAQLASEIGDVPLLQSSYFTNFNATSQPSMLGYWDGSTTNNSGNDSTGTIFEMSSDGTNTLSSSSYVNQLCFGNAGTLTWRRNANNSAWTQVSLWHSGNLTPSNYIQSNTVATLQGLNILGTASGTVAATITQDTNGSDLAITTGTSNQFSFLFTKTGGLVVPALVSAVNLSLSGSIGLNGSSSNIQFNSGQAITANGTTKGLMITCGGVGGTQILTLSGTSGSTSVTWDNSGNQVSTVNIQGAQLVGTTSVLGGNASQAGVAIAAVMSSGQILLRPASGVSSIDSVNAANSAYAALNFTGTQFTFSGGPVTFTGAATFNTTSTFTGTATFNNGIVANNGYIAGTRGIFLTGNLSGITLGSQGTYIGWNYTNGTGETDIINNQGGGAGGINFYNCASNGSSVTLIGRMDAAGNWTAPGTVAGGYHLSNVGANGAFQQINFGAGTVAYMWGTGGSGDNMMNWSRGGSSNYAMTIFGSISSSGTASFNTSDRRLKKNIKKHVARPLHRQIKLFTFDRIDTGEHGLSVIAQEARAFDPIYTHEYEHARVRGKPVMRLSVDKAGMALEQSMWSGHELDEQRKLIASLIKRVKKLEAERKKRRN